AVAEVSLAVVTPEEAMVPASPLGNVGASQMLRHVVAPDFSDRLGALTLDCVEVVPPYLGVPQCFARLLIRLAEGVLRRRADRAQAGCRGAPEPELDHVAAGSSGSDPQSKALELGVPNDAPACGTRRVADAIDGRGGKLRCSHMRLLE